MAIRQEKLMQYLVEVEEIAEEVLADRRQLIDLDRRRNKSREALRVLHKDKSTTKTWMCFGNMFLKLPKSTATNLLEQDFNQLDKEISVTRTNLKPKVNKLRDMEHKEGIKGFNLNPLSTEEMRAMSDII